MELPLAISQNIQASYFRGGIADVGLCSLCTGLKEWKGVLDCNTGRGAHVEL